MPVLAGALLALVAALALTVAGGTVRFGGGDARQLVAGSAAALGKGNRSLARRLAREAVAADGDRADARLALARAALGEGDGISAEAEVTKARDRGAPVAGTEHLFALARLLQGDPEGALRHARAADPAGWISGLRVQARALTAIGNPAAAAEVLADAQRRAPRDAALWADIARFRQVVGDEAGAAAAAARAVALDADDLDALLLRAQMVRSQFGLVAALPWFEAALRRDPFSYDVLIDYAATLGDAGRARDMLAATRRALAVRPRDPQAYYLLSVLAARAGDADLARRMLAATGDALAGQPGPLLLGATLDLDAGANEQAVRKLTGLIAHQPHNFTARCLLANALLRTGAARDALAVLRPITLRADADGYALVLAARAAAAAGDRASAAALRDRGVERRDAVVWPFAAEDSVAVLAAAADGDPPGEPSTAIPLIRALLAEANTSAALARAAALADANPGSPTAAAVLGDTLMVAGRADEAADAYRRAADIRFDEPILLRLVEALERVGDLRSADAAIALFRTQNPDNVAALRLAAQRQLAAGRHHAAIALLERVRSRIGNRDAVLLAMLAYGYAGAGDTARSLRFAAAGYALAPGNPRIAGVYGAMLRDDGDLDGALQLLRKAVAMAPRDAVLRSQLAQLYADIGRRPAARLRARATFGDRYLVERDAVRAPIARLG